MNFLFVFSFFFLSLNSVLASENSYVSFLNKNFVDRDWKSGNLGFNLSNNNTYNFGQAIQKEENRFLPSIVYGINENGLFSYELDFSYHKASGFTSGALSYADSSFSELRFGGNIFYNKKINDNLKGSLFIGSSFILNDSRFTLGNRMATTDPFTVSEQKNKEESISLNYGLSLEWKFDQYIGTRIKYEENKYIDNFFLQNSNTLSAQILFYF